MMKALKKLEIKESRFEISEEIDILKAASGTMTMAKKAGFLHNDQYLISTSVSELARNIFRYATRGEVVLTIIDRKTRRGIEINARDKGPGIENIAQAMEDHFSTSDGLGLGLPGVKRMMDEFKITSEPGKGTSITAKKWIKKVGLQQMTDNPKQVRQSVQT